MQSKVTLSFSDSKDDREFAEMRRPEIIKISIVLIVQRIIYLLVLAINRFTRENLDNKRLWLNSMGIGISIIALIVFIYSHNLIIQKIYAPIVIVSYSVYVFNSGAYQLDD